MTPATRAALRRLNAAFYQQHGAAFDAKRQHPWPGWRRIADRLPPRPLTVLDVGCGNGRFASYLAASGAPLRSYLGLDASLPLLAAARQRLATVGRPHLLVAADLDAWPLTAVAGCDLIAVFAVLQHVADSVARRALVARLATCLAPGGLLVMSNWRLDRWPKRTRREVPWSAIAIDPSDLEPGDTLLGWGDDPTALRYVHHFEGAELADLVAATGLTVVADFAADGRSGDANHYLVLRRDRARQDPGPPC